MGIDESIKHLRELDLEVSELRRSLKLHAVGEEVGVYGGEIRIIADGYGWFDLIEYEGHSMGEQNELIINQRNYGDLDQAEEDADRLYNGELQWDGWGQLMEVPLDAD